MTAEEKATYIPLGSRRAIVLRSGGSHPGYRHLAERN